VFSQQQNVGSIMNSRRSSGCFEATAAANNKENQCPLPPPDLSEETLLAPEHNEVLGKLRFISMLVDTIIGRGALWKLDPKPVLGNGSVTNISGSDSFLQ
jgi:hypothetical protein